MSQILGSAMARSISLLASLNCFLPLFWLLSFLHLLKQINRARAQSFLVLLLSILIKQIKENRCLSPSCHCLYEGD